MPTLRQVLAHLPRVSLPRLPAPPYVEVRAGSPIAGKWVNIGLAVESMKRHMTDEGWQLFQGLEFNNYILCGHNLDCETCCGCLYHKYLPKVMVVQDKREWDGGTAGLGFDPAERFANVHKLSNYDSTFKLTVLKDAHQRQEYHRDAANEMGAHGWIIYYHPTIVSALAPYIRPEHCIRTYHSVDPSLIPPFTTDGREGCLISGAVSKAYPMRQRLVTYINEISGLCKVDVLRHPGYHRKGSHTPEYLKTLSRYKVAICTSSIYGYALRKIVESTACGCIVVTNLPPEEVMPEIDGNLVRVEDDIHPRALQRVIRQLAQGYDSERQQEFADRAKVWYDYKESGKRLAEDIETLRKTYNDSSTH